VRPSHPWVGAADAARFVELRLALRRPEDFTTNCGRCYRKERARRVTSVRSERRNYDIGKEISPDLSSRELVVCISTKVSGANPIKMVIPKSVGRIEASVERGRLGIGCISADLGHMWAMANKYWMKVNQTIDISIAPDDGFTEIRTLRAELAAVKKL
jgi:hypothetical protein